MSKAKRYVVIGACWIVISPLLPFIIWMNASAWIEGWQWPHRYVDAVERFAKRCGVESYA
jgi:hypothetical protein